MTWSVDTFEDNVLVLELIIFVIKEVMTESTVVSDLLQSIEQKCEKQFNCFKSMFKLNVKTGSDVSDDRIVLLKLTSIQLKSIFSFDSTNQMLKINTNETEFFDFFQCLIKTSEIVIKNCLMRQLYRFGRNTSFELNKWFQNKFKIAFEFFGKTKFDFR